jgi:PKD repeat protein
LFELKTDDHPYDTSWELLNSDGDVVYSGGSYTGPNTVYSESWEINEPGCYTFIINDSWGDGICCDSGDGYYTIMDENNAVLFEGGNFYYEDSNVFERFDENILTADFTADQTNIFEGESISFTDLSSGTGITIWTWEFEEGDPATSEEQNPEVTYMIEGTYDVKLTISDGSNSDTILKEGYIEVNQVVGIGKKLVSDIKIFPNPSNGLIYIEGANNASVKIYNSSGIIVKSINNLKESHIDLKGNGSGIFFIHIIDDNGIQVNKKMSIMQ